MEETKKKQSRTLEDGRNQGKQIKQPRTQFRLLTIEKVEKKPRENNEKIKENKKKWKKLKCKTIFHID